MYRLEHWRLFLALAVSLIVAGAFRSAWATRLDGFTMDEPWHITAGSAYLRTGEYYLNPEHPPLVKLIAALAAPRSVFRFTEPASLHDKIEERDFVEDTMYAHNDADRIQSRVRPVMYVFNGLLLLLFAVSAFRVFGGMVSLGALLFVLIDPTLAAHWPVVMTDLPAGLLSVTCVLVCIEALRNWRWVNIVLLSIVLGLTLSVKHSGLIAFGFTGLLGLAALIWQFRGEKRVAVRRVSIFLLAFAGAVLILWTTYGFHYRESKQPVEKFNRSLTQKIADLRSPMWRAALGVVGRYRLLPRSYVWGLADIVRTGMEGRAHSDYAFGRLSFMERRPFLFPGYVAVTLPIPLMLLSALGCIIGFGPGKLKRDRLAVSALLLLAATLLLILARSGAGYAGVRHALTVFFPLAILAGFGVEFLANCPRRLAGRGALALALLGCFPALAVVRPWEYHNILAGGTSGAYRYFRNDSVDVGQRDKEIAEYYHRKLEPRGEVPYLFYHVPQPDLTYRTVRAKVLSHPQGDDLPPVVISGTILMNSMFTTPLIWSLTDSTKSSDFSSLRDVQPTERMGNVLVFRGTYYLPAARAEALFSRADDLLAAPKPDLARAEATLKEALALRTNDFIGWMTLGNLYLLRSEREQAVAAFQKGRDSAPPSPVRLLFENQIRLVSTQPLNSVTPMRDPGIE
jgi:hypothetical protein